MRRRTVICSIRRAFLAAFFGKSAVQSSLCARQSAASGQASQCGAPFGTQTVAPSSMSAWFSVAETGPSSCEPRHDAQHVAVDGGRRMMARNRADGARRIAPDARELQQRLEGERHDAAVFRHDDLCGLLEIARAAVVAEPLPELHELVVRAGCECGDVGERLEEALEIRQHGRDARLLQHDFGNPDAVRRWLLAPRQHARDGRIPGEQRFLDGRQQAGMRDEDRRWFLLHDKKGSFRMQRYEKNRHTPMRRLKFQMVETRRIELLTSCMPCKRSPS